MKRTENFGSRHEEELEYRKTGYVYKDFRDFLD
jgi:hypothetical protein